MLERLLTDDSLQALIFICLPLSVLLIVLLFAFCRGWHIPTSLPRPVDAVLSRLANFFARADAAAIERKRESPDAQPVSQDWGRWLGLFIVGVTAIVLLPHVMISLSGFPQWQARPVVLAILWCALGCYFCLWMLDPYAGVLALMDAKEIRAEDDRLRANRLLMVRAGLLAASISCLALIGVPFASVSLRIARGEKPISITGVVTENRGSYNDHFFLFQTLSISTSSNHRIHYEWFYGRVLRVGREYDFEVLPGSDLVLQVDDHRDEPN
jgi:hypothetical protein